MFPNQSPLEVDEVYRVNRARLAIRLNKLPQEIDTIPYPYLCDLLEVIAADTDLERRQSYLQ